MKVVMGVLGLSILAAVVGVWAASGDLQELANRADSAGAVHRASEPGSRQPSQKIQQWVNH